MRRAVLIRLSALPLAVGLAATLVLTSCGPSRTESWWLEMQYKNVYGPASETYIVSIPLQVANDDHLTGDGEERMFFEPVPDPQDTPGCVILAEVSGPAALQGRREDGFFYVEELAPVEPVEETFFGTKSRLCGFRFQPQGLAYERETSEELLRIPLWDGGRTGEVEAEMVRTTLAAVLAKGEQKISAQDGATQMWGAWNITLHQGPFPATAVP
jgi:hypothetical protein